MNRVLVTGASGFIGRHAIQSLIDRKFDVHGCIAQPRSAGVLPTGATWHVTDLMVSGTAEQLMSAVQPTHLLHLAWFAKPRDFWKSAENYRWVEASLRLCRAFINAGGRRIVGVGTCAEYDPRFGYCSESLTPISPASPYGVCKAAVGEILASMTREASVSAAWGRVFFVYGPHEHPDRFVASVALSLLRGEPARCSHGGQIRDFLHVEDAGDALAALLTTDVEGPVNIASGVPVTVADVARMIADETRTNREIQFGKIEADSDNPPMLVADVRRLTTTVSWRPKFSLQSGLADTVRWWAENSAVRLGSRLQG